MEIHMSLRDMVKYVQIVSNKRKSQSTTSVMDEVVLEYRLNGLQREVKDLQLKRDNLRIEVNDLRPQQPTYDHSSQ